MVVAEVWRSVGASAALDGKSGFLGAALVLALALAYGAAEDLDADERCLLQVPGDAEQHPWICFARFAVDDKRCILRPFGHDPGASQLGLQTSFHAVCSAALIEPCGHDQHSHTHLLSLHQPYFLELNVLGCQCFEVLYYL